LLTSSRRMLALAATVVVNEIVRRFKELEDTA
jgi:hypothetical protein